MHVKCVTLRVREYAYNSCKLKLLVLILFRRLPLLLNEWMWGWKKRILIKKLGHLLRPMGKANSPIGIPPTRRSLTLITTSFKLGREPVC
jgi:hypothetical protein